MNRLGKFADSASPELIVPVKLILSLFINHTRYEYELQPHALNYPGETEGITEVRAASGARYSDEETTLFIKVNGDKSYFGRDRQIPE